METIEIENAAPIPIGFTGFLVLSTKDKVRFKNGQMHCLDGPAVIYIDGREEYWVMGYEVAKTEQEFEIFRFLWKNSTYKRTKELAEALAKLCVIKS